MRTLLKIRKGLTAGGQGWNVVGVGGCCLTVKKTAISPVTVYTKSGHFRRIPLQQYLLHCFPSDFCSLDSDSAHVFQVFALRYIYLIRRYVM